jgi:hypothetical protein
MVELVDTQDLKSCSRKRSAGSIPALSTTRCKSALGFLLFKEVAEVVGFLAPPGAGYLTGT